MRPSCLRFSLRIQCWIHYASCAAKQLRKHYKYSSCTCALLLLLPPPPLLLLLRCRRWMVVQMSALGLRGSWLRNVLFVLFDEILGLCQEWLRR